MFLMMLLGKNENTQQGGDNSINVNAGRDVSICTGMTYSDVREIAHDVFRHEYEKLTLKAKEKVQRIIDDCFEKWLPQLPQEKFYRFKEPKIQFVLHDMFSAYITSDTEDDVEKILLNSLKACLSDTNAQKNAIIRRAVQTLPQLSRMQVDYLSFLFLFTCIRYSTRKREDIVRHFRSVVKKLYSDEFLKDDFLDILDDSGCVKEAGGFRKYGLFEDFFVKDYPHVFTYSIDEKNISDIFGKDASCAKGLFDLDEKKQFVLKNMTFEDIVNNLKSIGLDKYQKRFFDFLETACPKEQKLSFLHEISPDLPRFASVWDNEGFKHSWKELTVVGRAIATFNCKAKFPDFEAVEFIL